MDNISVIDSSVSGDTRHGSEERDEVFELHKFSSKETFRVRSLCAMVTLLLAATAVTVTITSYNFLEEEENENFETAFQQFARTVGDAAIEQQRDLRDSMVGLANTISAYAVSTNATWPFFAPLLYETFALDFKKLSRAELVGVNNIVTRDQRDKYIEFANANSQKWVQQGHMIAYGNLDRLDTDLSKYNGFISQKGENGFEPDKERDVYHVRSNLSPPPRAYGPVTNWNVASELDIGQAIATALELRNETLVSEVRPFRALPPEEHQGLHDDDSADNPHSFMYHPIPAVPRNYSSTIVGSLTAAIAWDASMRKLLPDNVRGILAVVRNNCGQTYTYEINGKKALYRGPTDLHESKYDHLAFEVDLAPHTHPNYTQSVGHCMYSMSIYPSSSFEGSYHSRTPERFTIVVAVAFAAVMAVYMLFYYMVQYRNERLITNAAKSNAIVSSMFPDIIRDRMLNLNEHGNNDCESHSLRSYLAATADKKLGGELKESISRPLADLYVEATVMFADIVGFTAWSSTRDPTQVFMLLETVYSAFDELAKKYKVFKVETVGDCYVAVTGVPNPVRDHAVVMARFARSCLVKMHHLMESMEVALGPDTGDLSMRIGIHSGPVTAGVLRGERARFQLFGDTMNMTSRIESTSESGRIQLSQETATLLTKAGKEDWMQKREKRVMAKGKGELLTYWLKVGKAYDEEDQLLPSITYTTETRRHKEAGSVLSNRTLRLVEWNVETLLRLLKQIVAVCNIMSKPIDQSIPECLTTAERKATATMPLEEVQEIIALPEFDRSEAFSQQNIDNYIDAVMVPEKVVGELHDYVTCIAKMYRPNSFHGFDHASHVVMSMKKYMTRIVAPSELDLGEENTHNDCEETYSSSGTKSGSMYSRNKQLAGASLHDHTYGITSDPLTQFACVFSGLIHDVDHTGVPNTQLIKENPDLSATYKGRSVAEQNSFDLAWRLLMDSRFENFRATLCNTESSLMRFRQLVINAVMATDLGDKELKALRNARWDKAFNKKLEMPLMVEGSNETPKDVINRKATIVIEHLIQASDVSHTMQHWHVYRKWNERLFLEMYDAYKKGRAEKNPADFWYEGEIGFFDFYIIPLAKKLKDCGVFGVSSDETLDYALRNRAEWEVRGREVIAEMLEKLGESP